MDRTVAEGEEDFDLENEEEELPLFKHIPELKSKIRRVRLCDDPTPTHLLKNTSEELETEIFMKRDDLTTSIFGGNKPRKYEFIIGECLRDKRNRVTTIGALGSNHCLGFAMFAERYGIKLTLYILDQPLIPEIKENLLRMNYFSKNTALVYTKNVFWLVLYLVRDILFCRRCRPHYFLEPGASDAIGIMGYVNAGFELYEQIQNNECEDIDVIYLPLGTAGTAIGLLVGLELAFGRGKGPRIMAISVLDSFVNNQSSMKSLCKKVIQLLQNRIETNFRDVEEKRVPIIPEIHEYMFERLSIDRNFIGKTYGHPTIQGNEAIDMVSKDSIHLDKIYTGKAFSGLIKHCKTGEIKEGERVLFWMTKNSADLTRYSEGVSSDWRNLPSGFHKYYDGSMEYVKPTDLSKKKND